LIAASTASVAALLPCRSLKMAMRAVMGTPGNSEAAQRKRVPRNGEKGIDFLARRVYVHCKPDADGSNPEAESQQNADGLDASLDCRRSALSEHHAGCRHTLAGRTISIQKTQRRGAPHRTTSSLATPTHSDSHQSACAHPVELEAAVNDVAAGGPFGAVGVCLQPGQFTRIHEIGIDIWARRVYVHCTPEADGSNPKRGRSAERRRVWGQTWSCRRSALWRLSQWAILALAPAGNRRNPDR
jgi:hypothetical protein